MKTGHRSLRVDGRILLPFWSYSRGRRWTPHRSIYDFAQSLQQFASVLLWYLS